MRREDVYFRTEAISENVRRMNGMIEQMLEIDRLETGKRRKREKLEGNCTLNADMESMKRVAENLVTNAVRHGRENEIIDIEMADGKVTISSR